MMSSMDLGRGFHTDGSLHYEGSYEAGFRQGMWTYFYANGNPQLRGTYERDRQVGTWQRWNNAGDALADLTFDPNGRLVITRQEPSAGQKPSAKQEPLAGQAAKAGQTSPASSTPAQTA